MKRPSFRAIASWLLLVPCSARADIFEVGTNGTMILRAADKGAARISGPADDEAIPVIPAEAMTVVTPPQVPAIFQASFEQAAKSAQVSPALLAALVWQESRWRPAAVSPKGARGLTQLMPSTARALAVDPANPSANLTGGAHYLRTMLNMFDGDLERSLAAYNAGPGRVLGRRTLPPIAATRTYVSSILDRLNAVNQTSFAGVLP